MSRSSGGAPTGNAALPLRASEDLVVVHLPRAAGAAARADAYLVGSRFDASVLLETLGRIGLRGAR